MACERQADFDADLTASVPSCSSSSRWVAQDFIDIYFAEFHPDWPILFRATFKPSEEPCVLLQSMAMIGLWIKGDQVARDTAMTFHHKLVSAIQTQRVWHLVLLPYYMN